MRGFLSAVIAVIGTRVIFALIDFHYDLLRDPFDVVKLLVDIAVFVGVFYLANLLLGKLVRSKEKAGG